MPAATDPTTSSKIVRRVLVEVVILLLPSLDTTASAKPLQLPEGGNIVVLENLQRLQPA